MKFGRAIEHAEQAIGSVDTHPSALLVEQYDDHHGVVTYADGVKVVLPTTPMFSDNELALFHRGVEVEKTIQRSLRGFSMDQLTRLDAFVNDLKAETKE